MSGKCMRNVARVQTKFTIPLNENSKFIPLEQGPIEEAKISEQEERIPFKRMKFKLNMKKLCFKYLISTTLCLTNNAF